MADYDKGNRVDSDAGKATPVQLARFRSGLAKLRETLPSTLSDRLSHLTGPSKQAKMHTFLLLAGPIGLWLVKRMGLEPNVETVYLGLLRACSYLWAKEIEW
jgi:hypothetical protein